ncbi:MAG: PhnE/PtxC family ABC transporter permease [Oscillospiraceae bacterium]
MRTWTSGFWSLWTRAGCTTFQKIRYGILPQLTADFTSTIIYRFDMNLRDATVLGLVGAGGIGAPLDFRHELVPLERSRRDFAGAYCAGAHHRVDLGKNPRQAGSGVRRCRNES